VAKSDKATSRGAGLWRRAEADRVLAPQDAYLMSKGNELKFKVGAATNTER
jgi:hypothetical protein